MKIIDPMTSAGTVDLVYKGLYKAGAAAAFIAALIFRRNLDAEWMLLRGVGLMTAGPAAPPTAISGWFALLQQTPLLGLTLLNMFDLVNYALLGFIFLALFAALKRANRSWTVIASVLGFIGITVYFASNQALTMLSLSHQYAASTNVAQQAMLLVAGQTVLAIHNNASYAGQGLYLSFLCVSSAGLIYSAVMLRSRIFSNGCAYVGILANGFALGYYIVLVAAPALVAIPISISAIFLLVWYILVGLRLYRLGRTAVASFAE